MYSRRTLLKVILLGNSGVGKTSLLTRYITNKFTMIYKATIGADFMTKDVELPSNKMVTLQLWDTAGQERFQSLGTSFYRGADCCILVYDVTIKETFDDLKLWRKEFLVHAGISESEAASYPFVVLGNKVDKETERATSYKSAEQWCQQNGNIPYWETSAKDATHVDQAFLCAAEEALAQRPHHPTQAQEVHHEVDLSKSNRGPSSSCCS